MNDSSADVLQAGKGSYGVVAEALDTWTGKVVAIKKVRMRRGEGLTLPVSCQCCLASFLWRDAVVPTVFWRGSCWASPGIPDSLRAPAGSTA